MVLLMLPEHLSGSIFIPYLDLAAEFVVGTVDFLEQTSFIVLCHFFASEYLLTVIEVDLRLYSRGDTPAAARDSSLRADPSF